MRHELTVVRGEQLMGRTRHELTLTTCHVFHPPFLFSVVSEQHSQLLVSLVAERSVLMHLLLKTPDIKIITNQGKKQLFGHNHTTFP
jgi:hypothetical protein